MRLEHMLVRGKRDTFASEETVDARFLDLGRFERVLRRASAQIKAGFIESLSRAAALYPELDGYYHRAAARVSNYFPAAYFDPAPDSYGRDWDITERVGRRFNIRLYDRLFDGFRVYPLVSYDQITGQVNIEWDIARPSQGQLQTNLESLGLHWFRPDQKAAFHEGEEAWHLLKVGFEVGLDDDYQLREVYNPVTGTTLPVAEALRQIQDNLLLRRQGG